MAKTFVQNISDHKMIIRTPPHLFRNDRHRYLPNERKSNTITYRVPQKSINSDSTSNSRMPDCWGFMRVACDFFWSDKTIEPILLNEASLHSSSWPSEFKMTSVLKN